LLADEWVRRSFLAELRVRRRRRCFDEFVSGVELVPGLCLGRKRGVIEVLYSQYQDAQHP